MKIFIKKSSLVVFLILGFFHSGYSNISITTPTNGTICEALAANGTAPAWTTLSPLTINESAKADFAKNKTGTIVLTAPTGWSFNTAATLTVSIAVAGDFVSFTAVITNSNTITLSWQTVSTTPNIIDAITISGIQVQAISTTSSAGPIYCSGTTGTSPSGLVSGTQGVGTTFANLSQIYSANAGAYQTICATSAIMAANSPTVGASQVWSFISGPVTPSFSNVNLATATVSNMTANGLYIFRWTVTTPCGTSSSDVQITKTVTPISNAGPDQAFCMPNSTSLAANFPAFGQGTWSIVSGPNTSTAQISNVNDEAATFAPTINGTYTLRWTITLAGCATTTDDVVLTVSAGPTAPLAGPSQTICAGNTATMAGNNITVGTGAWSVSSGPSLLSTQFSDVANRTAIFTPGGGAGTYILPGQVQVVDVLLHQQ